MGCVDGCADGRMEGLNGNMFASMRGTCFLCYACECGLVDALRERLCGRRKAGNPRSLMNSMGMRGREAERQKGSPLSWLDLDLLVSKLSVTHQSHSIIT